MEDDDLPESLVQDEEEGGFVDLDLRLVRAEAHPNGTFAAEGRGRHAGRTIGFALELDAAWKPTPIGERQSDGFFYWGTGTVRATGEESNALLSVLAELYQLTVSPGAMRPETKVAVVALANDPALLPGNPTHMKLFFESEDPERYAEVYVNVIGPEQRLELHEKDPHYRRPLLLALSEGAA